MGTAGGKKVPAFKPDKDNEINWPTFNGGLNNLFKPTELRANELAQADNLMLIGAGTPTGRWGSQFYQSVGSGSIRLLDGFYNSLTSTNYLLSISDSGFLTKNSGTSYSIISGASFVSGYPFQSAELGSNTYITASPNTFIKFDGTNLIPYVPLSLPTITSVSFMSGATGYNTYSWVVTALSTGETAAPAVNNAKLTTLPYSMASAYVKVTWNAITATPTTTLKGYNVYRGTPGNETLLASLGPEVTSYVDYGQPTSQSVLAPETDSTGGPKGKYVVKFGDRLVVTGLDDDPSKVMISGRYPYHDRFTALDGGGSCYVSPDDGDVVKGIGIQHLQTTNPLIVVYKNNSTYVLSIGTANLGNYAILDINAHLLTNTFGTSSGDTVVPVENDLYAFGRKGLYSTGQEPQFLNQIRSNEISSRIRTYVQGLSETDLKQATAAYIDYKYLLSFPTRKETMIYDWQRACFMGPWTTPFGITKWFKYYDVTGKERWLAGATDGNLYEFSGAFTSDNGTTITKILRTKKEDFGSWNQMKMVKYIYALFRNVRGSVNVNILGEGRDGNTTTNKSFNLTSQLGSSGWGIDQWGSQEWGQTSAVVTLTGEELARYSLLFKQLRVIQVEVTTTLSNSNFEFLSFRASAVALGGQSLPSQLKV
jgi:hypothetical protein